MLQKRSNFIKGIEVDGNKEKDFLLNSFSKFTWSRPMLNYRLTEDDFMRPDLLSTKVYGTQEYWWIILKTNPGLDDIYNDFTVDGSNENSYESDFTIDSIIKCPHPLDIKDYIVFAKGYVGLSI